ncbi:TetR/AcrR family transcriptional regulator [Luteimonas sp. TWI1416]|uniref:TetR/AcrR family transcriptional regulator n=1 Tax=unclassified Luteimonas TaxID=2629088 RepID=UPI003207FD5C
MTRKPRSDARARILDAALAVSQQVGAAHLTLDAVAAEAGVSKGGLLYHFASKDALLRAMVEHHLDEHRTTLKAAIAEQPATPGGYLQALVQAHRAERKEGLHEPHATRSFIAAAVNTPELMEEPRRFSGEQIDQLRRLGPRFPEAMMVMLAFDGLFFGETFEMLALTPSEREAVVQAIADRAAAIAAAADGA